MEKHVSPDLLHLGLSQGALGMLSQAYKQLCGVATAESAAAAVRLYFARACHHHDVSAGDGMVMRFDQVMKELWKGLQKYCRVYCVDECVLRV